MPGIQTIQEKKKEKSIALKHSKNNITEVIFLTILLQYCSHVRACPSSEVLAWLSWFRNQDNQARSSDDGWLCFSFENLENKKHEKKLLVMKFLNNIILPTNGGAFTFTLDNRYRHFWSSIWKKICYSWLIKINGGAIGGPNIGISVKIFPNIGISEIKAQI